MGIPCTLGWGGGQGRELRTQQPEQSVSLGSQDAPGLGGPKRIPTPPGGFGFW